MRFRSWLMVAGHSDMTHLLQRLLKIVGISGLLPVRNIQASQSFAQVPVLGSRELQAQRMKSRLGLLSPIFGCWRVRVRRVHLMGDGVLTLV